MKRIINIISCVAALAGIVAALSSCDPEYHRRGRGYEPDDRPGRPIDESDTPSEDDVIELENGYGEFYGQWYTDDTDNYLLFLYEGTVDDEGFFTESATMLTLDLLLPKKGFGKLASGAYRCSDDGGIYTFIPSYSDKDEEGNVFLNGSTLYVQKSTDKYATYSITDGLLEISYKVTGQYEISADIETENGQYKFHFKGAIDLLDKTQGSGEEVVDVPENVEMKNITKVYAEDWGMVWDGIPCTSYRDYILYFIGSSSDEYTCIEILTEEKYKGALPDATFNKVVAIGEPDDFVPGAIIAGYSDEDNYAWGTWYCKGGTAWYAASKGSLDMKTTDKGYSISFDFIDEDETYGGTFKGSYEGKVDFVDSQTKASGAGRHPVGIVRRQGTSVTHSSKAGIKRAMSHSKVTR